MGGNLMSGQLEEELLALERAYARLPDPAALAIGPNDFHPNADGHARLARRLYEALSRQPELERLWMKSTGPSEGDESP